MSDGQLNFDDWTGPFVASDHPESSHVAASAVVARDGGMGQIRRGGHRHYVLKVIAARPQSQEEAGRTAFERHGVGVGTEAGSDVGRRRCDDLEGMQLIEPARRCSSCGAAVDANEHGGFPDKKTTPWALTTLGHEVLARLDAGERVVRVPWDR